MKWHNEITKILGIKYPIIQGPFGGGYSSVELAASVSSLGGMGSFGAHHLSASEIINLNEQLKASTSGTYAINLWINNEKLNKEYTDSDYEKTKAIFKPFFDELEIELPSKPVIPKGNSNEKQLEAILEVRPPVFSFVYGIPDEAVIKEMQAAGIRTLGTATTVEEAVLLEDAGVDAIVATGFEAGGHRVAFLDAPEDNLIGSFSLIPRVVNAVNKPVIAAGGIADGRGIAAAMALGAQGVQIGTAFLATDESNATPIHRKVLHSPAAEKTVLTKSFTGRLARGTASIISKVTANNHADFAPYPIHGLFVRPLREAAIQQGRTDLISFWSGQSAPLIKYDSAKKLFLSMINETEEVVNNLGH